MVKQIAGTLTITIRKQAENYTIEANAPKGIKVDPHPAPQLKTLLSDQKLTNTLNDLSNPKAPATTEAIQKLGKALYDSLFADRDLLLAFGKVQGSASSDSGARLRLQIEPAELAALPWETLHNGQDWLSAQSTTPLVRKLVLAENRKPLQKLQIRGALRILFVGASPEGLDDLKVEKTANELETLLAAPIKKKQIAFNKLVNVTLEELRQELLKDYHILYFAGHGSPEGIFLDDGEGDEIKQEGKVIGRERGDKSLVSAETLADALKGKQTRLVFLAACETSKASDKTSEGSRLLRGFAQELAERSNLPAIVAMQYFISDMQALPLTTQFFAALAAGRPVDVAMAEARSGLMKNEKVNRDVFSPVLYLQAEDGALFPKAKNWPAISLGVAFLIATIIGGAFYRIATINEIQGLVTKAQTNLESNRMPEARIESIRAAKKIKQSFWRFSWPEELRNVVLHELVQTAYGGEELNRLDANHGGTYDIAFSSDGKQIATSGEDGIVRLWDANGKPLLDPSGKPIVLNGNQNPVGSVAFSPDGKQIITGGEGGKVKIWDISGKFITDFKEHSSKEHSSRVNKATFSPDGKQVVTYSEDQTVRFWDISGNSLGEYEGFNGMATGAGGERFALFKNDGSIWLWTYSTKQLLPLLTNFLCKANECEGNSKFLSAVALSPDGQQIATSTSVDTSGFLQLWDISGNLLASFEKQLTGINRVAFSPDGKYLVTSNYVMALVWTNWLAVSPNEMT
jgi:CHAT domain-containing protein/Tol biopolymer transport system component